MGQKVNPHGMRVGVIDDWDSKWFAEKDYAALLVEDAKIRQFLKKHLFAAGISKIGIKRVSGLPERLGDGPGHGLLKPGGGGRGGLRASVYQLSGLLGIL